MTIAKYSLALVIVLALPAQASETMIVSRPFVEVSGGSDFYIEGVGAKPTASFQLGLGYRWQQLRVGASFGWTHNLDWDVGGLCLLEIGYGCGSFHGQRDLFGGIVHGRFYPVVVERWLQPYVHGGIGFFVLSAESSEDEVSWAYGLRGGVGVEFGISEFVSLNLELSVVVTHFPAPDDYIDDRESHSLNTSGGLVIYF